MTTKDGGNPTTEQPVEATDTTEQSPANTAETSESSTIPLKRKKPHKKFRLLRWLIVFILIIAAYLLWQSKPWSDNTPSKPSQTSIPQSQLNTEQMPTADNDWQQQLDLLKAQVDAQDSSPWQAALLALQNQQQQLVQNYRYLYQQQRHLGDKTDGFLAETGYLLRVAQQRLYLEQDVLSAIKALETAHLRLGQSDDPHLLPLRHAIIQDLQRLQAVPVADTHGIALSLLNYATHADNMPLVQGVRQVVEAEKQKNKKAENIEKTWQDYLSDIADKFEHLIVVRYNANHQAAVLSPEQRFFVQQNLKLQLISARLLVLYKDEAGFKAAIAMLLSWLADYYDQSDNAVKALQKDLRQWQTRGLIPETLDLANSLQQFKRLNALGHYNSLPPKVLELSQ